jgi:hypothetical protein
MVLTYHVATELLRVTYVATELLRVTVKLTGGPGRPPPQATRH